MKTYITICALHPNFILISLTIVVLIVIIILLNRYLKKTKRKLEKESSENKNKFDELEREQRAKELKNEKLRYQEKEQHQEEIEAIKNKQQAKISYELEGKTYSFQINEPVVTVGRENCSFIVQNDYVSRKHFEIFVKDNNYYLKHLSTTNDTYVNGNIVKDTIKLNNNDVIIIGPIGFTFFI